MVFDFEKNDFPISVDFIGWKTLKATKVGRQILSARESHKNKAFWLVFKFSLKKAIKKSNPSDNRAQKSYTVFEYFFFRCNQNLNRDEVGSKIGPKTGMYLTYCNITVLLIIFRVFEILIIFYNSLHN